MMGNKTILTAAAVAATFAFAGAAQAKSINSILIDLAKQGDELGQERFYDFNDVDREVIIDNDGDGNFSIGDVVRGTLNLATITLDDPDLTNDPTAQLGQDGNNAMFGRFSLEVTGIDTSGIVTFGHDGSAGLNSGVLIEFYEDAAFNVDQGNNDAGFNDSQFNNTASHWGSAGLDGTTDTRYRFQLSQDFVDVYGGPPVSIVDMTDNASSGITIANVDSILLDWLEKPANGVGDTSVIASIGQIGNAEISGSGTSISGDAEAGFTSSKVAFKTPLTVVPVPAAAPAGVALLGLLGVAKIRRRRSA